MKRILFVLQIVFLSVILIDAGAEAQSTSSQSSSTIFFTASLNAAQESPTDTSKGSATFWGVLSPSNKTLAYQITYASLTSKFQAAHFHLGLPGVNGGVVKPITGFIGNTVSGTWSDIPDSLIGKLIKGEIYVNIHSADYPAGELRGQVTVAKGIGFKISADAANVLYADTSTAKATGWAVLTDSNSVPTLTYSITVAGLTSKFTAAHFHLGSKDENGGVEMPIPFSDSTAIGQWTSIPDTILYKLLTDGIYVNIHSFNYPAGEIRSQVEETGPISFYASLDGSQEVPAVNTNATGTAWFVLSSDLSSLAFHATYANLSSTFTDAHIHYGVKGKNGGVMFPITTFADNTASGKWNNIPDSLAIALIKNGLYINVHSTKNQAGEIRGQIMLNTGVSLSAMLDGSQDVPPLAVTGSGTSWLSFADDTLNFRITVAGLTSKLTDAHFHLAPAGSNGGVIHPISYTDSTTTSYWTGISDADLSSLVSGGVYENIHSYNNPAGELRGQVFLTNYNSTGVTSVLSQPASSSRPNNFSLSQNYPNPFNPTTTINYSVAVASHVTLRVYDILGNRVATLVNNMVSPGNYRVVFNGTNMASGVYFFTLKAGSFSATKKLVLLK